MGFFRTATEERNQAITEELFYGIAAQELMSGNVSTGLYAKAAAESGGDTGRTNAAYIRLRVRAMHVEHAALREQEAAQANRQARINSTARQAAAERDAKQAAAERKAKQIAAEQAAAEREARRAAAAAEWEAKNPWLARYITRSIVYVVLVIPALLVIEVVFEVQTGAYVPGSLISVILVRCLWGWLVSRVHQRTSRRP